MIKTIKILFCLLLIFNSPNLFSQNSKELVPGYYIVVSAYAASQEKMAHNYATLLREKGHTAEYGYNASRKFYFVYLKYFNDLRESLTEMKATRRNEAFKDAWVRVVSGDIPDVQEPVADSSRPQTHAISNSDSSKVAAKSEPTVDIPANNSVATEIEITDNEEIVQYPVMTLGNTEVFLSLFHARNNRIVEGEIEVVDTDRAKLISKVKGNEYLNLPNPNSKSGQLTLICDVFGYRKIQHEINYPLPLADTVKDFIDLMGTTLVVNFYLVRYHRGDQATLYNVYFYNDAALMLPESKYELNSLLQLLQENPAYRIKLHGHSNGNYHGKIITAGPEKNYFSLTGSTQRTGSAKDLSYNRAEIVKEYLVSQGVDPSRMEVKGWGGRKPIYDKNSVNAKKNVRVVVEILEE